MPHCVGRLPASWGTFRPCGIKTGSKGDGTMQGPAPRRLLWRALAALAGALTLAPAALADDAGSLQSAIEAEQQRQQELLERMQQAEQVPPVADTIEGQKLSAVDPREAPRAPAPRDLPAAIFEEQKVTVRAGAWGNDHELKLLRRVLDADRDGHPELVRYVDPESGYLVRQEEDRNYDGALDAWSDYEWNELVRRELDENGDGKPDVWETYSRGRMTSREVDRDYDGVRDAFYRYQGDSLADERYDANNDGKIDLTIVYDHRRRVRSEEDQDKDGRVDLWTTYHVVDGVELVQRIERDRKGRGFADTFETFEAHGGKAVLSKREEDLNGDGEIDVTSLYRNGKLYRREILDPSLLPGA
jgi:hypothetical protein